MTTMVLRRGQRNGSNMPSPPPLPPTPPTINETPTIEGIPALPDRYVQEVQLGMVRYNQTLQERDDYKQKYETQVLENKQLGISIEQAKEQERIHVQRVIDEAITHQKSLEAECGILRAEIERLNRELSERAGELAMARANEAKLLARVDLVRAALSQMVDEQEDSK